MWKSVNLETYIRCEARVDLPLVLITPKELKGGQEFLAFTLVEIYSLP